jgi:hypothetical protein
MTTRDLVTRPPRSVQLEYLLRDLRDIRQHLARLGVSVAHLDQQMIQVQEALSW